MADVSGVKREWQNHSQTIHSAGNYTAFGVTRAQGSFVTSRDLQLGMSFNAVQVTEDGQTVWRSTSDVYSQQRRTLT